MRSLSVDGLMWIVRQDLVSSFQVTDRIGWSSTIEDHWLGSITISEPDVQGWHLGWFTNDPNMTYHWRGPATKRDSRWHLLDEPFLIDEVP